MTEMFWMCYVEGTREPFVKHPTLESAKKEAERLARLPDIRGKKVFVLGTSEYCCVYEQPVTWWNMLFKEEE